MSYTRVDISSWNRREHFEIFRGDGQCTFSQTVQLDITRLLDFTRSRGYKFYPVFIHSIAKVVNRFPEYRMAMKGDELIVWDCVHPNYTTFHPDTETFSSFWSHYHDDLARFLAEYSMDREKYRNDHSYFPKGFIENVFYVSANPWVSFTSFDFNFASANNFFAPLFTVGKYYSQAGKTLVPLAVQVHHAVCDGFHAARLITELQKLCDEAGG
ncbi:type A chloramphenicol O-acetyltransferase [Pseudomonas aeruginosa]|uniref:type A chloramphenicol O-acetyltransferase n=1 Tax=Pseudomonas aeruginosa group TaxID=136841 RepID=UPI00071C0070|nr:MULTISPECIES: type A chloramphenicol O-acetyltransferase [Pseudomonas aeruginosa group]KSP94075.1 type A chloramphenicol O-acetyltransferase [Pseudomonas aeruginosa]MCW8022509.1 type A chloramphenicol O-acetyltransferase [Pseudomonas aeruginosa]RTT41119.1 type A chloramphenicol O-acetyltransferase [Pseudomonas paraeruginosa]